MKLLRKSLRLIISLILAMTFMAASLVSCGQKETPAAEEQTIEEPAAEEQTEEAPAAEGSAAEGSAAEEMLVEEAPASADSVPSIPSETYPGIPAESVTFMLYMTGSDLESGAAAATKDLEEIANSGVDLTLVNVLVLTGGAQKWHSTDPRIPTDANVIYRLTKEGYEELERFSPLSMGNPQNLSRFLTYCRENYPADSYDLILWDHGNGPVIGYGSDKQYGGDGLTLPEMREALAASPFGADQKLSIVGMDACLMSSAELMCILGDYAEYLVASQETEPHFGWNYDFLQKCGHIRQEELAKEIVQNYFDFCEAYYSTNPFFAGDVTLAAIDLSCSDDLQNAVDALFKKAAADVSGDYNKLALSRIRTHGYGRASTGSEYDLVDLEDLMDRMQERYPAETGAVREIIRRAVLVSESTIPDSSGISLYYPYFNKNYYRKSWKAAYAEIGVFPSYALFLQRYEQIWLGTDLKDVFEGELVPAKGSDGSTFTMQLTKEQAEQYAYARYYILKRKGKGVYSPVYMSTDVTEKKGTLTARFDGKVIYCSDHYGKRIIPTARMWDAPGDRTDYTLYGTARRTENGKDIRQACDIQISVEKSGSEGENLIIKGIFPSGTGDALGTGKREPIDPADWTLFSFVEQRQRYLTRDSEGRVAPFYDWPEGDWTVWNEMPVANGLNFTYEPLYDDGSDYYILFEVADVQDNRYSSELLPITLAKAPERGTAAQVQEVIWEEGSSVSLYYGQGVRVELAMQESRSLGTPQWRLYVYNENSFPVRAGIGPIQINGTIFVGNDNIYLEAEAGAEASLVLTQIENTCRMAGIDRTGRITFSMRLERKDTGEYLVYSMPCSITIGERAEPEIYCGPSMSASASGQVLLEKDGIRAELEGMGNYTGYKTESDLTMRFKITNEGKAQKKILILGALVDGLYFHEGKTRILQPGQTWYTGLRLYTSDLKKLDCDYSFYPRENRMYSVGSVELLLGLDSTPVWCPVTLDKKGEQEIINPEGTVVYEDDGFVLYQEKVHFETRSSDRRTALVRELWGVNKSDRMRMVTLKDAENPGSSSLFIYTFAPGAAASLQAYTVVETESAQTLKVRLTFTNYFGSGRQQSEIFVLPAEP